MVKYFYDEVGVVFKFIVVVYCDEYIWGRFVLDCFVVSGDEFFIVMVVIGGWRNERLNVYFLGIIEGFYGKIWLY